MALTLFERVVDDGRKWYNDDRVNKVRTTPIISPIRTEIKVLVEVVVVEELAEVVLLVLSFPSSTSISNDDSCVYVCLAIFSCK